MTQATDNHLTQSWLDASTDALLPTPPPLVFQEPALQCEIVVVDFGAHGAVVTAERFVDGWVATLRDDESVFSDGPSMDEAISNLVDSAEEDLELLGGEDEDSLARHLVKKVRLLRYLFEG